MLHMLHASLRLPAAALCLALSLPALFAQSKPTTESWPHWRGPRHNGVATANVPVTWSDSQNVAWKVEIPGRGFSTPVVWGKRLFLTTAIPTGQKSGAAPEPDGGRRGPGGGAGAGEEHRLQVLGGSRERQGPVDADGRDCHAARGLITICTAASRRMLLRPTGSASTRSSGRAACSCTT